RTDDGNSCQITGTSLAATAGAVTVTVTARNATGADVTVATVVVIIRPPPEIIPILRVDAVIDFVVTALDQSFVFTNIGAGEISECTADKVLPMGLRLAPTTDRSSCQITGTPLALTLGAGVAYNIEARNPFGASMVAATIAVRPAMPRLEDSGRIINLYVGTSTTVDIVNSGIDVSQSDGCAVIGDAPSGLSLIESYMQDNGRRSCRFINSNRNSLQADHTFLIRGTADSGALDYTRVAVRVLAPPAPPPLCVAHDAYLADVDDNLGDGGAYPVSAGGNDGFLYLTGAHSDGRAYPGYIFRYKGTNDEDNHVYQATIAFDATDAATSFSGDDATFIITSDDLQTRFAVQSGQATSAADVRSTDLLTDGTVHPVARGTAADITGHNQADLSLDDAYLFTLTLATADPAQGLNAGTLSVQACTDTAKPTLALPAANSTTAASAHAVAVHVRSTGQAAQARILVRPASDTAPPPTAADIMASASAISQAVSADGNVPLFVTGLSPETAYNAYVVSIDQAGNTSEILSTSFSTTATADTMPVAVTAPALEGVGAHSATLKVSASETGELFAIVLPSTDSAPTSAADITSSANVIEVDIPPPLAPDGTADVRATFSGLLSGEDYKIYYVAIDAAGNTTAVLPSASGLTFTTTLTLPALTSISPVTLELGIEIEPIIWPNTGGGMLIGDGLALACNARVSASVAVPLGLVASVTADGRSCQITGAPMTETAEPVLVKIFANNRVGAGNNRRSSAVAIRVRDTLAPVLQLATAPTEVVSDITEFSASVAYAANEGGTLYTLVLGAESAAPDMATIKAMAGGDGGTARAVQTITSGAGIVSLSGLMPGEMYTAYLVMEDDALTPSPSAVVSVDFSSNTMTLASPRLANLDDQTFVVGDTLETPLVFVNEGGGAIHPDDGSPPGCTGVAIPPGLIVSRTMDGSSCQFTGTLTTPGIGTAMVTASNITGTTISPATVMYTVTPAVPVVLASPESSTFGRAIITIPHDGIVYGLILASNQSPPSVDVIQRDGVMVAITPGILQILEFDNLIAETTYTAYVVVRSNGLVSPRGSNSFTTPPLPVISVTAAATSSTMATVTVNHSTPGQLDVILLPADATPPASPSDIEAMSLHPNYRERDINENEMSSVFNFFGLTPGTSYIGYAFIEASLDGTATNSAVTASAATVYRVAISVINFTGTGGATAIVTSNLAGTAYGLLIQDGTAPAPTDASAVIGHSDVQSMTIASGLPVALPITGLTVGLSYTYYAVVTSGDVGVEVAAHTFTAPTVLFNAPTSLL
nr:hypothetical protein [Gammaproteobacteria bacterium]